MHLEIGRPFYQLIFDSDPTYLESEYFFVNAGDRIKKIEAAKLMAHEYSFLAGFLQVDGGEHRAEQLGPYF